MQSIACFFSYITLWHRVFLALVLTLESRQFHVQEDKANAHVNAYTAALRCVLSCFGKLRILHRNVGRFWCELKSERFCRPYWGVGRSRLSCTGCREPQCGKLQRPASFFFQRKTPVKEQVVLSVISSNKSSRCILWFCDNCLTESAFIALLRIAQGDLVDGKDIGCKK